MFLNSGSGTRFKLYPQPPYLAGHREPEIVVLSPPVGALAAGPSDDFMYVVDPADAKEPYEFPYLPPYRGLVHAPAEPDTFGHFDYLSETSREFMAAHMYGGLRLVMDIWQGYFGRPIRWHWRDDFERMELVPLLDWPNAQSGYGYIETGFRFTRSGERRPLCLNFDILAHEMGHTILFSELGIPEQEERSAHYLAFHEACSDLIALISLLHFESVLSQVLAESQGNLYLDNELNRIGELSNTEQLRFASHAIKLTDVDHSGVNPHDQGAPFTGAVFDILVQVFLLELSARGLIPSDLAAWCDAVGEQTVDDPELAQAFAMYYQNQPEAFQSALRFARDFTGQLLSILWTHLNPNGMQFAEAAERLCQAEYALSGGRFQQAVQDSLQWRHFF